MTSSKIRAAGTTALLLALAACSGVEYDTGTSIVPRSTVPVVSTFPGDDLTLEGLRPGVEDGDFYGYVTTVNVPARTITVDAVAWDDSQELGSMKNVDTGTRVYGLGAQLTNAVEVELRTDGVLNDSESYDLDEVDETAAFEAILPQLLRDGASGAVSTFPSSLVRSPNATDKLYKFTVDDGRVKEIEPVEPDGSGTDE